VKNSLAPAVSCERLASVVMLWVEGRLMRREWEKEELIACWTLVDDDWRLVTRTRAGTLLGGPS
jgi:hypothetical protein